MPLVIPVLTFLILIIILSALRTRLVYELSGASLLMFESVKPGTVLYSMLVLPGTIIHELSHWVTAEVLRVKTGEITILPELKGESETERLGSVATERTDPIRGFLIGIAPFISGLLILLVLGRLLQLGWGNYLWWQNALIIYGIMVTGNSMMISKEDRRTWPIMIILIGVIAFALNRSGVALPESSYPGIRSTFDNLNLVLGVTAGFNLVMIGGSYALRRLIEKVTRKRIVHK
jgi:hypothetical protein